MKFILNDMPSQLKSNRVLSVFLLMLMPFYLELNAQLQNNNWIFGFGSKVNFSGPTPVATSGSFIGTNESTASVSDPVTGQLLFYSDGRNVWNANNEVMPNGSGLLGGFFTSTTQGAVIVPFPNDNQRYYLFTLDELELQPNNPVPDDGLRYSVVDMSLDGGMGDVQLAGMNTQLATGLTEKLIVIRSPEIQGFWLIAHKKTTNQFFAWKIDAAGLSPQPVVSTTGSVFAQIPNVGNEGWAGAMDASPDGNRIALPVDLSTRIEFFDFNKTTGILSNPLMVNVVDNSTPPFYRKYGACFSPDGSKFYFSNNNSVYQLNLNTYTSAAIAASQTLIYSPIFEAGGNPCYAIEQAPNNKLYVAIGNVGRLDEISNPNAAGLSCGYVSNALSWSPAVCALGLPQPVPLAGFSAAGNACNLNGNLVIYSNYDGGILTINVDQDIPDLKVGICTYEPIQVSFTGPFVGNITQVVYAGMNSNQNNNNCGLGNFPTSVTGVPPGIVSITPPMNPPQVGYTPYHGNGAGPWGGFLVGVAGYCDTTLNAGGASTPDEVVYFFTNATGGTLLYHQTQYNCWVNQTLNVSAGGNCCIEPPNNEGCPPISVNVTSLTDASCFGSSNGSATVEASGGASPYTYNWQPVNLNGATQNTLAAGTYTVNVADQNGCPGTTTLTIDEPPQAIALSINTVDAGCNLSNGSATVTASGGSPGYSYSWFPSGNASATLNNLAPGTYSVTVTDSEGCTATASTTVSETGCGIFCNTNGNLIIYSNYDGGALTINVDQNIPDLKIGISTYEAVEVNLTGPFVSNVTSVIYAGFDADNDNCGLGVTSTTVTGVNPAIVQILFAPPVGYNPAHGFGNALMLGADACDTTMSTGGNNTPDQIVYYFANATGGTLLYHETQYNCWSGTKFVSNAGNCCIEPPNEDDCPAITVNTTSVVNVGCFGESTGSATLTSVGGLAPYTYTWTPGNLSGPSQSNLPAGTYPITVSDANNCPGSFTLTITQPATAVQVSSTSVDAECGLANGSATATASGGTAPYAYSWSPSGGNTATASSLPAGVYVIEVSDDNGCTVSDTVTIINPGAPEAPSLTVTQQPTCAVPTGEINITAPIGAAIQYSVGGSYQTALEFSGLTPGTYLVTAQDVQNGCTSPATTVVLDSLPTLLIGETISDVVCGISAGAISLVVTGGTAPYTYAWTPAGNTGAAISNLAAGAYSVSITDAEGCEAESSFDVDTIGSLAITVTPATATITLGDTIGLSASGAPSFVWSPNESLSCTVCSAPLAWPQQTTTYQIGASDSLGCRGFTTLTIEVDIVCNEVFIPSIFSPNGKGPLANETLCLYSNCAKQLKFVIHNRWGQRVFETEDIAQCWDGTFNGKEASSGVYAYNLYILQSNGEVVNKTGTLQLVR